MNLDGLYVPHDDEYQNEYLPDANERLAWVSGFTGSFGNAFVFTDRAILFADGRYTLQAADQTDPNLFEVQGIPDPGAFGWLAQQDMAGKTIGYDPKLISPNEVAQLKAAAASAGANLVAVAENPIDRAWEGRPEQPTAPVVPHDVAYAGVEHAEKRASLGKALKADKADATVITSPASVAWAFNIRGGDVSCTPLPLGRAIEGQDRQRRSGCCLGLVLRHAGSGGCQSAEATRSGRPAKGLQERRRDCWHNSRAQSRRRGPDQVSALARYRSPERQGHRD